MFTDLQEVRTRGQLCLGHNSYGIEVIWQALAGQILVHIACTSEPSDASALLFTADGFGMILYSQPWTKGFMSTLPFSKDRGQVMKAHETWEVGTEQHAIELSL